MREELREKRQLLERLKEQLEESRVHWEKIRVHNSTNQKEWNDIRSEFDMRRAPPVTAPIDLVSDIVVPELGAADGSPHADEREERLQLMEKQCRHLYDKLVNTSARNAALVGRLASIHQHYSSTKSATPDESVGSPCHTPTPCALDPVECHQQAVKVA